MLGYGLVALPKKMWKLSDYKLQIQLFEWRASETKESLEENISELVKQKSKIKSFRSLLDNDVNTQVILDQIWIDVIIDLIKFYIFS